MFVHRSNRMERLVDALAEVVLPPLASPTMAECIAVQGRGMERWLSMELSRRLRVWANPRFPFPRRLIEEALAAVLGDPPEGAISWEPETLMWGVSRLLPRHIERPEFAPIQRYLDDDRGGRKRIALAQRIADTFDHYAVYRPDLVARWEGSVRNSGPYDGRGTETVRSSGPYDGRGRETVRSSGPYVRTRVGSAIADPIDTGPRPGGRRARGKTAASGQTELPFGSGTAPSTADDPTAFEPDSEDEAWQAILWRALGDDYGRNHVAARGRQFIDRIAAGATLSDSFPTRVSLFGLSTLPPLYLQILAALSGLAEVHLFLLSPSDSYWGEIRGRREQVRALAAAGHATASELHLDEGNPLLASLGRLGRDFQYELEAAADYEEPGPDRFEDPGTGTILSTLQSDVLHLVRRARDDAFPAVALADDDDSLEIHVCHSPMREIEVLHDQLLALFEKHPDLEPHDVIVMTPRIDAYAPLIDAVFAAGDRPAIPYRVADRSPRALSAVADALTRLLATLRGRFGAPEILDLLESDPIRERFDLAREDLDLVRSWIARSGIRWAEDAHHRHELGQPEHSQNTWRFGLDRLLLGYALPGGEQLLWANVLPYDDVEGTTADTLGKLAAFCDVLFAQRRALAEARPIGEWRDGVAALLEQAIAAGREHEAEHRALRVALESLARRAEIVGFTDAIDLPTFQSQLEIELVRGASSRGFLSGGVSFCELTPMRSIPFPIVCLLGLNDTDFPRSRKPPSFDLMGRQPRRGDRSARDDDRYLFLEALLSARRKLLVTYVGQRVTDNAPLPPSVVVNELLDTIEASFDDGPRLREKVQIRHPLQPFSPRYFDGSNERLFSFAGPFCEGAAALRGDRRDPPPFLTLLPPPEEAPSTVTIDELNDFFRNPARAFLKRRLRLFLDADDPTIEEREPMEVNALDEWRIGDRLLAAWRDSLDGAQTFAALRAAGVLPLGSPSEVVYRDVDAAVSLLTARVQMRADPEVDPVEVDCTVGDVRVTGILRDVRSNGLVRLQYSQIGGPQEIGFWIGHLLLTLQRGSPQQSLLVGRPKKGHIAATFRPVENPLELLGSLLALYRRGLETPVPFFARASRAYVETFHDKRDVTTAAREARKNLSAEEWIPGEAHSPYVRLLYGPAPVEDFVDQILAMPSGEGSDFGDAALTVFLPLLAHRQEGP